MPVIGQQILPVLISILILILVAVLRNYSTTAAAITATMPVMVPLSLWIVYSGEGGDATTTANYLEAMIFGVLATLVSVIVMWYAARIGWGLVGILVACYGAWAIILVLYVTLTRHLVT